MQQPIPNSQLLIPYCLHLADTTLILSQRNSEWCGHGPILEQDIAITNISLDLLGQSRNFYQYAAELISQKNGNIVTEDSLAYLREATEFKNLLLAELPRGDWGNTILRQYLFSEFQFILFEQLKNHADTQLAAIAAKGIKETTYHIRWSKEWVIRLGDGTAESHDRIKAALSMLWAYTDELFIPAEYEVNLGIDFDILKKIWLEKVMAVFEEATLSIPENIVMHTGGKNGLHTSELELILAEMQQLQRTYPGAEW